MLDIKVIAAILLVLRLIAVVFLFLVLKKQYKILRTTTTDYSSVRKVLIFLVFLTFCGNFVPILIDSATLLAKVSRTTPNTLGVSYAFSNAITAAVSAVGWFVLYRLIAIEQIVLQKQHDDLTADNKHLTKDNKAMHKAEDKRNGN